MLERLLLKYLTKKGKIAYFVGQIVFFALLGYYLFGIKGYSMDEAKTMFFTGMFIIVLCWAAICFVLWRKPTENNELNSKSNINTKN